MLGGAGGAALFSNSVQEEVFQLDLGLAAVSDYIGSGLSVSSGVGWQRRILQLIGLWIVPSINLNNLN